MKAQSIVAPMIVKTKVSSMHLMAQQANYFGSPKKPGIASVPAVDADETVYFGSWDQKIYAIDGKTGEPKMAYSDK